MKAEMRFLEHGRGQIMARRERFFWPSLGTVGVRLLGGDLYWRKCLEALHAFVTSQNEKP